MEAIKRYEKAPDHPGLKACVLTGATGPFVGLGYSSQVSFDLGFLLISEKVAEHVAKAIGWETEQDVQTLRDELGVVRAENAQLRAQVDATGVDVDKIADADVVIDAAMRIVDVLGKRLDAQAALQPPPPVPGVTMDTFR